MGLWGQPEPDDGEGSTRAAAALHGVRALLALALATAIYLLFPGAPAVESPLYDVGSVAPENVIAPFAFRVEKSAAALQAEQDAAARTTTPVFVYRADALDSARAQVARFRVVIDAAFGARGVTAAVPGTAAQLGVRITPGELAYLRDPDRRAQLLDAVERSLERLLVEGVASNASLADVRGEVAVQRPGGVLLVQADSVPTFNTVLARARRAAPDPGSEVAEGLYVKLLSAFFRPTLEFDRQATAARRADAVRSVPRERWLVREGEKIVGAHEVVGREEFEKMQAMRSALQRRLAVRESRLQHAARTTGAVLYNFVLVCIVGVTLRLFRPQLYRSFRVVALFAIAFAVVLATAAAVSRLATPRPELVPVALAAVLFSILFDPRISLVASLVLATLVASQGPFRGTNALFVLVVAGVAAAVSVSTLRRRTQAYFAMLVVAGGYLAAALVLGLTLGWDWREVGLSAGAGALCAIGSVALAMGLLAPAEEFTGIETYLRLLEWSDLNRPVLRRLSLEAPGTYAHTIALANLAEAACNAIGANGLLARVGTYYHDIGKLERPTYFVENQARGRNPHDKLKPTASAAIIRNHVREGLALAEEIRLPKAIRAFIAEHHGTNRIVYFYEKARERGDGTSPNAAEFAYPGPIPQSAETAVVMLADGVEAAARALHDPTPQRIRDVVEHIVRQRIDQGQLRDAPLTLQQLEIVKEQFVRVLLGMHHNRIDYPAASGGVTAEFASA